MHEEKNSMKALRTEATKAISRRTILSGFAATAGAALLAACGGGDTPVPTAIRAAGQGFSFNFGRVIAAVGALQTTALLNAFDNDYARACSVTAGVYVVGLVLVAFAPETRGKPLPA